MSASAPHSVVPVDQEQSTKALSTSTHRESSIVLDLTFLLTSGQRILYQIDEQFLATRNIPISGVTDNGQKDPLSISIYILKELIQREWKEEWGLKPSSPSSIRLIYFGRLLDDNLLLKNCKFNNTSPNIIHMTVRPQDTGDEEDTSKSKITSKDRENRETTAGCRCNLM